MKYGIYLLALGLGLLIGSVLVRTRDHFSAGLTASQNSATAMTEKPRRAPEAVGVKISRMISAETRAMNESMPLDKATDVLFTELKSPLRTRAFLKSRVQMMTTDQLIQALMNGEVQTKAELEEVARRLAKEDPEGAYDHLEALDLRFYGMANLYTFIDSLQQTWADADAPALLARLKKMKRGGAQQDNSLRFSSYWAKIDPQAAVRHFSDLVYLRNMQDQGAMVFTDDKYAGEIVKSWQQRDEETMRTYIANLPAGKERSALEAAVKKLDAAN